MTPEQAREHLRTMEQLEAAKAEIRRLAAIITEERRRRRWQVLASYNGIPSSVGGRIQAQEETSKE